ncbi:MAG: 16S rRNA (uracil(1498)-N(3))-methyltransferase [Gammaproteobacteria bacterium]|nr:16S rRNA (uracil(1498)-N(3))-methyltransferase [Gammaproteobacteria bacterium]MBT8133589.1 16S rRNA (uracil(1498)-N(3))-methyltransferase [Gammaproteobacteria bacterium]NNJ50917.1 16S rRNA (uracil(1498)-N(3))-methyltransferase [Gammaproteobacteria bacterium]
MRITRLYHGGDLHCGDSTRVDANASNHLIRVLRSKPGADVILFNGDGYDYLCKTIDTDPKKTSLSIESRIEVNKESSISITLIQGLSRQDRMETTIQKSIELGVNRIIPVICQRSNYRLTKEKETKKLEHWRKVAISACEQSGRCLIPEIVGITSLKELASLLSPDALKLNLDPAANDSLKESDYSHTGIEIFIGPEGGLNNDEREGLTSDGFNNIRFGPRILRTETAGPAVISAVQTLWGDL